MSDPNVPSWAKEPRDPARQPPAATGRVPLPPAVVGPEAPTGWAGGSGAAGAAAGGSGGPWGPAGGPAPAPGPVGAPPGWGPAPGWAPPPGPPSRAETGRKLLKYGIVAAGSLIFGAAIGSSGNHPAKSVADARPAPRVTVRTTVTARPRPAVTVTRTVTAKPVAAKPAPARRPAAAKKPSSAVSGDTVTYIVTGGAADVTYGPSGSDFSGRVPMTVTRRLGHPSYYAISAQLQGGGSVACEIKVNGRVVSRGTASGGYNIASCEIVRDPFGGGWQDTNS